MKIAAMGKNYGKTGNLLNSEAKKYWEMKPFHTVQGVCGYAHLAIYTGKNYLCL